MDERTGAEILSLLTQAAEALNKSDSDTAIGMAEALLDRDELPDAAWVAALTIRAKACLNEGLLPDALEDLDAVLEVVPDDAEALVTRGYVQRCMGMLSEAEADYEAAIAAQPDGEHGANAAGLLTALKQGPEEVAEPFAVGVGRPLVMHEEPWGDIALPDCWEPDAEPLEPPASRWTTGDTDLDLLIAGAMPAGEATLEEIFETIVARTSRAITELFDEGDIVHTRETLGGLPAHMVTASSTVPRLVMANLILLGPAQVLTARLLDHRPGGQPAQCMNQLMSILDGARLPA